MGRRAWLQKARARNKRNQNKPELLYLPDEILMLILGRLCSEDQIRFRAVCRRWHALEPVKPRPPQNPWLFMYKIKLKAYVLYNPLTRKSLIFEAHLQNTCSSSDHWYVDQFNIVLAVHSGRLLVACTCSPEALFIYNPFNRFTRRLPRVNAITHHIYDYYAFNYCPVEQRFTAYVVAFESSSVMVVRTWRSGDQDWKTDKLSGTHVADWKRDRSFRLICGNGVLYCYFPGKEVAVAFRHTSHGFDWIEVQLAEARLRDVSLGLLEGDLHVVSRPDDYRIRNSFAVRVDFREKIWVAEEIKEKAYFPNDNQFSAVVISEPNKVFAGRFVSSRDYSNSFQVDFRRFPFALKPASVRRKYHSVFHKGWLDTFWIEPPTL